MAYYKSRGLRGSFLEEMINFTNDKYRAGGLALVQKIPTPIKPIEIDDNRHITLAYFEKKSTVDYIGVVQGIPVCFDAKEVSGETFALSNVHEHQFEFMSEYEKMGGVSFLIIYFKEKSQCFYLRFERLKYFMERAKNGGRKSIRYDEFDKKWMISEYNGVTIHYLEMLNNDLVIRDNE